MKRSNTKRALTASVLSLVMCCAMLIGSTFAWFTDSASTGVNTIKSGNLDLVLEYLDENGNWAEVGTGTKLFKDGALWEPGHTEVAYIKVRNNGSLAFKYQLAVNATNEIAGVNVAGESFKLSKYLKFGKVVSDTEIAKYATREEAQAAATDVTTLKSYSKDDVLAAGDEVYLALVVYMPTDVGNEANHNGTVPSIDLGVIVKAAQTPVDEEQDSYGKDYDESALYDGEVVITTQAELDTAIANEPESITAILSAGNYSLQNTSYGDRNMTFKGTNDATEVVMDLTHFGNEFYSDAVTFENMTVKFPETSHKGLSHTDKVVFNNCILVGTQTLYAPEVEFNNCTFEGNDGKDIYYVWTYGIADATFNNCTFNTNGKAVLCYFDGTTVSNLTFNKCVFNSDGTVADDKAAVEVGSDNMAQKYNITFTDCTANGFVENPKGELTGSNLWGNKNSMSKDLLNVIIDGKEVY